MQLLDWLIMTLPIAICLGIALYTRKYVRGVADFMAGGRHAGRYLIMSARSEQGSGAVVFVALFQMFAVSGFTLSWWGQISVPVGLFLAVSGFVIYRYRETRALTLGEFFERRYTRGFRIFSGILGFFAGILNFGVIPAIGAKFMVYFMGMPDHVNILESSVPTHLLFMGAFLTMCVITTTMGGQITILLTDCVEGMFSQVFYVIIAIFLFLTFFHWSDVLQMLLDAPSGKSLVNPFDSSGMRDFNIWYVLMSIVIGVYSTMAWQNSHAFNSSASTPHESRMGYILGKWRSFAVGVMVILLVVCAMTYLHSPTGAALVGAEMAKIADPSTAEQMRIPVTLSLMLPAGIKGMLLAICLMGIIAGDSIHLHSWGSIFIQDVVIPIRGKPFEPARHLSLLRWSIAGVAAFALIFGAIFPFTEYVVIWFGITMAIFTGGAGAAIIGGLYWSRGTASGAWTAMIIGSVLSTGGIAIRMYYSHVLKHEFPLNGLEIAFVACIASIIGYIVVSILTFKKHHDMEKLLNRGVHAIHIDEDHENIPVSKSWISKITGIDDSFSPIDKATTYGIVGWSMLWFLVFAVGSVVYLCWPWESIHWANYWFYVSIALPLVIAIGTTVWFTWGCSLDLVKFFRKLKEEAPDAKDDGMVNLNAEPRRD